MVPQACTTSLLCSKATTEKANSKKWQTHYGLAYVKEAKKRGLTCGVDDVNFIWNTSNLPNCKGSYSISTWTDCFGEHKFLTDYTPSFVKADKKYQGSFGTGDTYVGEWGYGLPNGFGRYSWGPLS